MAEIDSRTLGRRIAEARARAGRTQEDLAADVLVDRSVLAKIESGQRRTSAIELVRIATALDVRIEWFVQDVPPALVSRRNAQDPGAASPRIDAEVERISRAAEFVAGHDNAFTLPSCPVQDMPVTNAEAEKLATTARAMLGLAPGEPCLNLAALVAARGLLAFAVELGTESADAATILLPTGGVALVNATLKVGRRRLALAHELGHYLVADEYTVDWRVAEYQDVELREHLFDRFARALLLPESGVLAEWGAHTADGGDVRTAAVKIASAYRVDMATLARRLAELRVVGGEQATLIRSIRTTRADIVELNLVVCDELKASTLPKEYELAVLRLFRNESISSARALDLMLGAYTEDMLPELPRRFEHELWQYLD